MTKDDLTVVYYTSNILDRENPVFLANTKKQLAVALGDLPLVVVSQKPVERFYNGEWHNVVVGKIGRSHLNLYKQIVTGVAEARTKYVAMAEDDILYSYDHFHSKEIDKSFADEGDCFLYDMNKVSLFTWTKMPMFSFRSKRKVVNQLIAPREYFLEYFNDRYRRMAEMINEGRPVESILHIFGDPGRYDNLFGITPRRMVEYYCNMPSIVFSHPKAFGYLTQGKRKRLGDIRIIELYGWGRAEEVIKLWGDTPRE